MAAPCSVTSDGSVSELLLVKQEGIRSGLRATVDNVLASMADCRLSDSRWKHKATKKGIAYYVDTNNAHAGHYRFCCMGSTPAKTEDVIRFFLVHDTEALQRQARILYDNVLDAQVLAVLDSPTASSPFKSTYVRYTSLVAPAPLDDRDMCVAVATDVFTHDDGSAIGYCLWDSVDIPECPGLVRSRMFRSGYLCRTAYNARSTEIIYLVNVEAGGPAPRLATWLVMERFGANLLRLCNHFRRKRLNPATFCPRDRWPATREATHCRGCVKKFTGLSKRSHCSACGVVFCSPCCAKEEVDLPGVGITVLRFCHLCLASRGLESQRKLSGSSDIRPRRVLSQPAIQNILDDAFHRLQLDSTGRGSGMAPVTAKVVGVEW